LNVTGLLRWYAGVRRPLPWRFTRDPWAILVSEVMLQQTQVSRVVPHWQRFLERFPDPAALAAAPAADVLAAWSGLGYNRRALALQDAARAVARDGWPADAAALRALPGIGPYTAAAVASFAWDEPVAAVDTNVRRVLERHDGRRHTPAGLAGRAQQLLPPRRAADFNQAMMELGATVCAPRRPSCGGCPVRRTCATAAGAPPPERAPRPAARVRFEETDRWLRGRIVAALVAGDAPPTDIDPGRMERALTGLERDGLVVRDATGLRLP
jgi:A/G-specific adenine glycosylase